MRLRLTAQAARELRQILATVAASSPQGARRIESDLRTAFVTLLNYPKIGRMTNVPDIRRDVVRPYLLFYRITAAELVIAGIRHAARNPRSMPGR